MNQDPMTGWCGTLLDIDLTTRRITRRKLDRDDARRFLGGRGLNSKTLCGMDRHCGIWMLIPMGGEENNRLYGSEQS